MEDDSNLSTFRRRVNYFDSRARVRNINNFTYLPQSCTRSQYPGSFTDNGLYMYGATVAPVRPNWDTSAAQPLNWDKPEHFYSVPEQFHNEFYKNNTTLYDRNGQVPYARTMPIGGMRTATGYRKPTIQSKQIWLAEEKYYNDY